jgi:hypothetical protein
VSSFWDRNLGFGGLMPQRLGMPLLYERFLSSVVRCGVRDRIVSLGLRPGAPGVLLRRLGIGAGLIHIDASHEYDARTY